MTATRFYLPSTGAAAVSPAFTLSGFSWTDTTQADRIAAVTTKINSAITDKICNGTGGVGIDQLFRQYVSAPIQAQTISGTVKGQIRALQEVTSNDARAQIVIYVVSNDGSALRGVLYGGDTGALSSEFVTTGRANRKFPRGGAQAVSSVVCSANDRIVMEIGARRSGSSATQVYLVFGDTGTDLPEDETTTSGCAWIEFSADILNPSVSATATVSQGTLTLTGKAMTGVSAAVQATASQGTLTLTGQAMTAARYSLTPTASQGALTLTGKDLTGVAADGSANVFDQAVMTLTGQDMLASWEAPDTAQLTRGILSLTGKALTGVSVEVLATIDQGTLTLTGQDATGRANVLATVAQGTLTLTGQSMLAAAILAAIVSRGTLTLTGKDLAISAATTTGTLTRGTLTLSGSLVVARQGFSFYQVAII